MSPVVERGALTARPRRALVLAAYAAVYVIWGSTYLAIRVGIETLPPFGMAAVRFLLAGALLYAWARVRGASRPTRTQWGAATVVGALLLFVGNGAVTWAEQRVPSGIAALLVATEPLWIVLLVWAQRGGARPNRWTGLGLGLGLAGVAVLVGPAALRGAAGEGSTPVDLVGAAVIVGGALAWAAGSIWRGRSRLPTSAPLATGMQMLAGGALLLGASLWAGEPAAFRPEAASLASVAALGYLAIFGSIVGFSAYAWLLTVEPPTRVATYAFVNPVVAVGLGWAVAGEPLSARVLVAAAVIVGAVVLLTVRPSAAAGRAAAERETISSAPRIARLWHGRTRADHADAYLAFLHARAVPDYAAVPGNQGVYVLRRLDGAEAHFQTLTLWTSEDAVRAFAGPDATRARYYPEDATFLLEREPRVEHYDVLDAAPTPGPLVAEGDPAATR